MPPPPMNKTPFKKLLLRPVDMWARATADCGQPVGESGIAFSALSRPQVVHMSACRCAHIRPHIHRAYQIKAFYSNNCGIGGRFIIFKKVCVQRNNKSLASDYKQQSSSTLFAWFPIPSGRLFRLRAVLYTRLRSPSLRVCRLISTSVLNGFCFGLLVSRPLAGLAGLNSELSSYMLVEASVAA